MVVRRGPLAALGAAVLIWATTFVVSSHALTTVSPAALTVLRFALATAVLTPLALQRSGLGLVLRAPQTALLGLTGVAAYYGLQNLGLQYSTAGTAALLQATLPVATAFLAMLMLGERVTRRMGAGLALATTGVALVSAASARLDRGVALILVGVAAYALYTVLLRRLASPPREPATVQIGRATPAAQDPVVLAAGTAIWGVIFLVPWQLWELADGRARLPTTVGAVLASLYLGLVASGGTLLLWTYGARHVPAAFSGILTAAVPPLGYVFAVATGEHPTSAKTIGGVVAITGVLWATLADPRPTAKPAMRDETIGEGEQPH